MHDLSSSLYAETIRFTMLGLCCGTVGFLLWFLIGLLREDRRLRKTRVHIIPIRSSSVVIPIRARKFGRSAGRVDAVGTGLNRRLAKTATALPETDSAERLASKSLRRFVMALFLLGVGRTGHAQSSSSPAPLPTPSITGPLQASPPLTIDAGALGKLDLDGVLSGMGLAQSNHVAGDSSTHAAITNAQLFLQKAAGWWQFFVQAGAYDIPTLGSLFLPTGKTITDFWGPVPVAFAKFVAGKNTSIEIGALPSLMGAESTFDFQNMNIERGLLWNQENSINRGIQVNQTIGKFTASFSWNDGFYSNRYSWLSGSLTYTKGPHSLEFGAMGNLGQTVRQTLATPVQNNGSMYALIYTYAKGNWIVQPYYQYGSVPTNPSVGVVHGASTDGIAALVSRTFKHGFSTAGRLEYIASTGSIANQSVNLLYGPGSGGFSFTLTPTYQYQRFFARGDLSVVRATDFTPGDAFGVSGRNASQARAVGELGLLF